MKFIYFYSEGCLNCHYISLLMKKMNIYSYFTSIESDSAEGIELKNKYNLKVTPVILIFNNNNLVDKYSNIEKPELDKIRNTYFK